MAYTATLNTVQRAGDPGAFDLNLTYLDSNDPDWHVHKTLRVVVDPALTAAQQRAAIVAQITADANLYKQQSATFAALLSLVGQVITLA